MPRDDLSIDFVKRMPPGGEALDPALILEDWINRVANLPEEIRFLQDEIADKDRQYNDCVRLIDERDGRIQKFIKINGSHEHNPREEGYRKTIMENFKKAEGLAEEKISLSQKMQAIVDRHTRQLDMQIKQLYDRNEPGFTDPDELPSLLRPSAANKTAAALARASISQSSSPAITASNLIKEATKAAASGSGVGFGANAASGFGTGRAITNAQARQAQAQQSISASAPASPAATMIMNNRQAREGSAGPGSAPSKRSGRTNSILANAAPATSGLARHSSLGPGTPKTHQSSANTPRAGSAGPRASKGAGSGSGRKGNTSLNTSSSNLASGGSEKASGSSRKKGGAMHTPTTKTSLSRVKRPAKSSAASSTAESELSDASSDSDSNSSSDRDTPARGTSHGSGPGASGSNGGSNHGNGGNSDRGSSQHPLIKRERDGNDKGGLGGSSGAGGHSGPGGVHSAVTKHGPGRGHVKGAPSSDDRMDLDDEEAGDDNKYCLCQNVSFGDMVACDNDDCPYEWFHWSCVGLKSEPNGTWYCPVCSEKKRGGGGGVTSRSGAATNIGGAAGVAAVGGAGGFSGGGSSAAAGERGSGTPATTKKGK